MLFFNNKKSAIFIFTVLIFLVFTPISFAHDNATGPVQEQTVSSDYYFDASIENDTGDGSFENPYKELTDERLFDNSVRI